VSAGGHNPPEIYNTLVLWYFAKKGLRHWPGKRNFLVRSQGFIIRRLEITVGEVDPNPCVGSFRREFHGDFLIYHASW
jgi:hypothetical protein